MNKEIEEIMAKNLPQHVGEVLNKRLVQADKDAADLEASKKEVIKLEEANQILIEKVLNQDAIKKIQKETEQLKEDLEKRERNLRITMLTLELDEANKRADIAREFTFAVFKNPTFKTMEQHVGTTPVKNTYKDYSGNITETHLDYPTRNTVISQIIPE